MIHCVELQTGLGWVKVEWSDGQLCRVLLGRFAAGTERTRAVRRAAPDAEGEALVEDLTAYFSGQPVAFQAVPQPAGATLFQRAVWQAVREIPYGETRTYGWVAERLGRPGSTRAVGTALGKNRTLVVVPCHRVVGSDGALTGFSCGMDWKRALLELEGR